CPTPIPIGSSWSAKRAAAVRTRGRPSAARRFSPGRDARAGVGPRGAWAGVRPWQPTLAIDGVPERIAGMRVSWNFFRMLGVHPAFGRDFRTGEDNPNGWHVVIVSDRLWRRRFGGDP